MSEDSDSGEGGEYETAVAAASFVIATLEEAELQVTTINDWESEKKRQSWFWRQNSGRISDDSSTSSEDNDNETALAAATFAVATLEEAKSEASPNKTNSIQHDPAEFGEDSKRKPALVYIGPPENTVADQKIREAVKGTTSRAEKKAEAWEKSAMAKIRKRYEKQYSSILSWENEKKVKARSSLDKVEGRLNLRKARANHAYENEVAIIDMIAKEERALAAERKRKDESKVKKKANKIRSTGRVPVTCFCFG